MDYSKLSDFEINGRVARATQKIGDFTQARGKTLIHDYEDVGEFKNICVGWKEFDPCKNPADAWQIIVGSRISLSPFDDFKECGDYIAAKYKPTRDNSKPAEVEFFCCDKPLRAAMIVYLMMQESE